MTCIIHCKSVFSLCLNTADGSGWKHSAQYILVNAVSQGHLVAKTFTWMN